jgi:hypothetical protein
MKTAAGQLQRLRQPYESSYDENPVEHSVTALKTGGEKKLGSNSTK